MAYFPGVSVSLKTVPHRPEHQMLGLGGDATLSPSVAADAAKERS
jgi:hypothetical protein